MIAKIGYKEFELKGGGRWEKISPNCLAVISRQTILPINPIRNFCLEEKT
jgi:hypothetical protein